MPGRSRSSSGAAIIEKIERNVSGLGEDLKSTLPYFKHLLSVDTGEVILATMDPRLRRGETFDALRRLLLRATEVQPKIIVVEDLHWVDNMTEDALLSVVNGITNARVLLILTYRPEYQQPFGERTIYTRIALNVLDEAEIARMTRGSSRRRMHRQSSTYSSSPRRKATRSSWKRLSGRCRRWERSIAAVTVTCGAHRKA
jgi:predicted ATPase